jgi:chemotaxis response regulator CheB
LFALCREVADRIDGDRPDSVSAEIAGMEAQLREIARAIERLEKSNIQVPDAFRAEKTRLAAAVSVKDESTQALTQFADGLGSVVREIRTRLDRRQPKSPTSGRNQIERTNPNRTSREQLRKEIILALQSLGGRAPISKVLDAIERNISEQFLPADVVVLVSKDGTKQPSWVESCRGARKRLLKEGVLRSDSPKGIWELNDDQP